MTINKEQAVSDAPCDICGKTLGRHSMSHGVPMCGIYPVFRAKASHPLEQQQACKHCGMIEEGHEPSECCGDGGGSTFEAVSGAWQLIETAPDGDILLWDGREIDVGYAAWEQGGKPVYFNGDVRVDATHWMPLPEPPRNKKKG